MGSRGGSSVAMGTESTQRWTSLLESTPEANPQRKLGNLVHVSQCRADPGLWPLSPQWGGAVSRPAALGCNPARPSLLSAGECPLYARAIVISYLATPQRGYCKLAAGSSCVSSRNGACGHS